MWSNIAYTIFNLESFQKLIFAQMLPSFAHNKNLIKQKKKRAERVMDFQSPRQRYTIYSIQLAQQFFFSWINRSPRILYAKEELKGHDSASFTLAACKLQLFYFIYNNCKVINIDLTW